MMAQHRALGSRLDARRQTPVSSQFQPSRQRISPIILAFTAEAEPASFLPSSTYASLPRTRVARVRRRVPLPELVVADEDTRCCLQAEVACQRRPKACDSCFPSAPSNQDDSTETPIPQPHPQGEDKALVAYQKLMMFVSMTEHGRCNSHAALPA